MTALATAAPVCSLGTTDEERARMAHEIHDELEAARAGIGEREYRLILAVLLLGYLDDQTPGVSLHSTPVGVPYEAKQRVYEILCDTLAKWLHGFPAGAQGEARADSVIAHVLKLIVAQLCNEYQCAKA